jgi:hypothetical protein
MEEERKHKKSKALIITIICIILLLIIGYLLFQNRDAFGVKTSSVIAKIFSPLSPSNNSTNLNKIDNSKKTLVQALADIKKDDNVSVFGTGANNIPLAKTTVKGNNNIYGYADQDIASGDIGEVTITGNGTNTFWNSFSNFLGNLFNTNKTTPTPPAGGWAMDSNSNWSFNPNGTGGWVYNSTNGTWAPPGGISNPPAGGWVFNYNTGTWDFDSSGTGGWVYDTGTGGWVAPGGNNGVLVWIFNPGVGNWTFNPSTGYWTYDNNAGNWIVPIGAPAQPAGGWTYNTTTNTWVFDANGSGGWVYNPGTGTWVSPGSIPQPPSGGWIYDSSTQTWTFDPTGGEWIYNPNTGGWISPGGNNGAGNLNQCSNGASNPPACTTNNGVCINAAMNPPLCTVSAGNICVNGANNPPACTTSANGTCINGATNPPDCTTNTDNSCVNGATNPPDCTVLPDGTCANEASNPPLCTIFNTPTPGLPDLIAGSITPTSALINTSTTLSSTITNIGTSSTGSSFSSFFAITTVATGDSVETSATIPSLGPSIGSIATVTHTFATVGEYSIRACADKSSSSDTGTIAESDEDNNCGPWTTFTVTNSIPIEGDVCLNGADNPTLCTTVNGLCVNGANNPPGCDSLICANGATDYPTCTNFTTTTAPKCLDIENNPLTFTDEEKARLAVLLRKFYLISSTLRTADDISTTYNELDQQNNFISQIEDLTSQCYAQVGATDEESLMAKHSISTGDGTWARHGNPWYFTPNAGGSFPYTTEDTGYLKPVLLPGVRTLTNNTTIAIPPCEVVSGYYYGTLSKDVTLYLDPPSPYDNKQHEDVASGSAGNDCQVLNTPAWGYGICIPEQAMRFQKISGYPYGEPADNVLNAGCKWKAGIDLQNTERILNIW